MHRHTAAPPSVVLVSVGALLFVLGGLATTGSSTVRLGFAIVAVALVAIGASALFVTRRVNLYAHELTERDTRIGALVAADAGLRTKMAVTLRDPLAGIVGLADRMITEPGMTTDRRLALLEEIVTSAREVEGVLARLAVDEGKLSASHTVDGVVLLDEEARSVMTTAPPRLEFTSNLGEARAWGDAAQVRQILRTVFKTADTSGCHTLTVTTEQRAETAVVTVSAPGHPIPIEAIAALTGNAVASDIDNPSYVALREAAEAATAMRGSIGYTEVFGAGHVVIELERAIDAPPRAGAGQDSHPSGEEPNAGKASTSTESRPTEITFARAMNLRPERPTAAIRLG